MCTSSDFSPSSSFFVATAAAADFMMMIAMNITILFVDNQRPIKTTDDTQN
jgi:hypothetical protein